jgi:DNA ligase 1
MKLPILFKKTHTGKIQYWEISVVKKNGDWYVVTEYGQHKTSSPQLTKDIILRGKNIGKKNETTIEQQAKLQAEYKWNKQKKKGYVESEEDAKKGKVDKIIKGGILPMLAQTYEKQGHKIRFPCYVQPKLDGHRCIAVVENGECTLWSRTRKPITGVPHIVEELESTFPYGSIVLDGELYSHDYRQDFEVLTHFIKQKNPIKGCEIVEYHIYDLISEDPFRERYLRLKKCLGLLHFCVRVTTQKVLGSEDLPYHLSQKLRKGYEGIIVRNADAPYQNRRTADLQKCKPLKEDEFQIVGVVEGKGKLRGHVGSFICVNKHGIKFKAKMSGRTERLKTWFEKSSIWKGKILTVQYQDLTGKNGVPRFPVGLRMREDL